MANESPRRRRVLSLRWVVSGAAVLLTSITVLGIGGLSERNARQALTEALQSRLLLEARNLALTSTGALLSDYPELTLGPVLREMAEDQPELAFALVLDLEKKVRGHQDPRQIGQEFSFPPDLLRIDGVSGMTEGEVVLADGLMLYATAPVNHRGGETIGTAVVAVYRSHIDAAIWEARREQAVLVAILLGVGIVSAITFMTILLRPVNVLRAGLERIGEGDLETPVELKDRTELGLLAETVNEMAASIRRTRSDLVEKERLAREVELAREIQSSLLPSEGMKIGEFVIAGAHRAAAEVGGDYYDIFPLTDGRVGIAIADVSGKGLAGCLVTSMLSVLLRAFRETAASPRSPARPAGEPPLQVAPAGHVHHDVLRNPRPEHGRPRLRPPRGTAPSSSTAGRRRRWSGTRRRASRSEPFAEGCWPPLSSTRRSGSRAETFSCSTPTA